MKGLQDKVAIVTGGATLIGAGVARAFGSGHRVAILDIDAAAASAWRRRWDRWPCSCPPTSRRTTRSAARAQAERFGGMDFLVNLACTYLDDGFRSSRADWLAALDVNVVSGVMLAQAVHPHMRTRGGGAIVNFTSISARVAQTGRWLYPVSKAAMAQLTRSMAMDLAPDRIRVNAVSPGWTWCRLMDEVSGGNRARTDAVAAPFHMLGRVGEPDEVAQVVLFLCSITPASSPAPTTRWMADTPPWARSRTCRPSASWPAERLPNNDHGDNHGPTYCHRRCRPVRIADGPGAAGQGLSGDLLSNRTPDQIRAGKVMSSHACSTAPCRPNAIWISTGGKTPARRWRASAWPFRIPSNRREADRLGRAAAPPAQAVDQRLKMPAWMDAFVARGGDLRIVDVGWTNWRP
jgi:NAD(P)-dependent dehydrogenase (short-subunit alcohol dehydrogenase family)